MSEENIKEFMKRNCAKGYEFYETKFDELALLLQENAAYTSFQFKDGIRSKENIVGGTKFLILDVDKSKLTDKETHILLNEYNHHIARTSNPEEECKFRVLIELDCILDIDDLLWNCFIEEVGKELGLVIDILPKAQIFFSYASTEEDKVTREVLSQLEGVPLPVKPLLDRATLNLSEKATPPKQLPKSTKTQFLSDPRTTFEFAFLAEKGERSRLMYRALAYAIDLGADKNYVVALAEEINNYWVVPLDKHRLKTTLIDPALRKL